MKKQIKIIGSGFVFIIIFLFVWSVISPISFGNAIGKDINVYGTIDGCVSPNEAIRNAGFFNVWIMDETSVHVESKSENEARSYCRDVVKYPESSNETIYRKWLIEYKSCINETMSNKSKTPKFYAVSFSTTEKYQYYCGGYCHYIHADVNCEGNIMDYRDIKGQTAC